MKNQKNMHLQTTSAGALKSNSYAKYTIYGLVIAMALLFVMGAQAQSRIGRIAFGIEGGGNKYYGDYTDNQFAFHGAAFIRWNIRPELSLHVQYNAGQLKYKATEESIVNSGGGPVNSVNHMRVGGWDALLSYNFFPEETFVPYLVAGIELLNFEPNDAGDVPLRGNANAAYSKDVVGGALGVGFEMYISDKITFNGKGLLHLTGTDWIDDYSHPVTYRQDAFLTMGLGFSYYIFAPEVEPAPYYGGVTNVTNNTYETTNNTYENSYETVVYHTDTVYRFRPEVNAVYNFPGTLFIVNTDQFNTAEPGNIANLYRIKTLVNQCPGIRVEIQGHASNEGTAERNQELSEMRANRIRNWLVEQGVSSSKVSGAVGFGTRDNAVREPSNVSAEKLEAARVYNRRIAVRVVETCN
jgi:outer membrane protein OmpA-like peptidoglycan-associated protein